jgi:hypothetical protein
MEYTIITSIMKDKTYKVEAESEQDAELKWQYGAGILVDEACYPEELMEIFVSNGKTLPDDSVSSGGQ